MNLDMVIDETKILPIGKVLKTHGIQGELNIALDIDTDYLTDRAEFIIAEMDGIPTPFSIESIRPKGATTLLVRLQGVDSVESAKPFVGKIVFTDREMLQQWLADNDDEEHGEGMYADALKGFSIVDSELGNIGVIEDLNFATQNALFEVRTPDDRLLYIPIAEDFIDSIDEAGNTIHTTLPDGLLEMQ